LPRSVRDTERKTERGLKPTRRFNLTPERPKKLQINSLENPHRTALFEEVHALGHVAAPERSVVLFSRTVLPAPDLRLLNRFCKRISDAELNAACMRDNDAYFAKTVRKGKIIVGVTHMPPWDGVLKQELAWAIQTFIESRAGASK
jgi:hypothetical protein